MLYAADSSARDPSSNWSVRQILTGEWATSPLAWLISMPFLIITQHARLKDYYEVGSGFLLAASGLGQIAALACLLIAGKLLARPSCARFRSVRGLVITWFVAGACAGVVAASALDRLTSAGFANLPVRIVLMGLTSVATYSLVTFAIGVLRRHRQEVARLSAYRDALVLRNQESGAFADDQERLLRKALDNAVLPALRELGDRVETLSYRPHQEELDQLRLRVVLTSESIVRRVDEDLDRTMHERRARRLARIDSVPRAMSRRVDLLVNAPIPFPLGVAAITVFAVMERMRGCAEISAVMATSMIIVLAGATLVRRTLLAPGRPVALVFNALTLVCLLLIFWGATRLQLFGCSWTGTPDVFVTSGLSLVLVLLLIAVAAGAARQGRVMSSELAEGIEQGSHATAALDEAGRALRDQVALVLNGVIQGRLAGIALALQAHLDEMERGGHPSPEQLVDRVTVLLQLAEQDLFAIMAEPMRPIPLPTVLRTLQARWSGLLAVDWAIDASAQALLDSEVRLLGAAARVIDDAVSNASRHGRATEVIVRVGAAGLGLRWLRIRVQDNGSGPVQASPVRGSAALVVEQMHGTWTLNGTDEEGAILVVDLPADRLMVEAEPPRT